MTGIVGMLVLALGIVVEDDVVTVDNIPAIVETKDVLLLSPAIVDMSGTTGAVCVFFGRDTNLIPVWQDSWRLKW